MFLFDLIKRLLVVNDSFEPILSHSALRRSFRFDAHDRLSVEILARPLTEYPGAILLRGFFGHTCMKVMRNNQLRQRGSHQDSALAIHTV